MNARRTLWLAGMSVVLLAVSGCSGRAPADAVQAWDDAGAAYAATNFSRAARLYRKAEERGYAPGALYYNLGNVYYRQGRLGRAIAAYRQAQWLLPRDGDVAANLATARRAAQEQLAPREWPATVQAFLFFYCHVSPDESLWLFSIATVLVFAGMIVYAFWPGSGLRQALVIGAVVWVVLGGSAALHLYRMLQPRGAVVSVESATVRSGPAPTDTALFVLHDGAEVQLLSREGEWCKIGAANQKGWIAARDLTLITLTRR